MHVNKFVKSICKFAAEQVVLDRPPMDFHGLNKAIEYLNSDVVLPLDIKHWDQKRLTNYLSKTIGKKEHLEDWIIQKRHILRESNYQKYQEALYRLQQRYEKKIRVIKEILSKEIPTQTSAGCMS